MSSWFLHLACCSSAVKWVFGLLHYRCNSICCGIDVISLFILAPDNLGKPWQTNQISVRSLNLTRPSWRKPRRMRKTRFQQKRVSLNSCSEFLDYSVLGELSLFIFGGGFKLYCFSISSHWTGEAEWVITHQLHQGQDGEGSMRSSHFRWKMASLNQMSLWPYEWSGISGPHHLIDSEGWLSDGWWHALVWYNHVC